MVHFQDQRSAAIGKPGEDRQLPQRPRPVERLADPRLGDGENLVAVGVAAQVVVAVVVVDIEVCGGRPTADAADRRSTRWRRRGIWLTIRSTVARMRSGDGGRCRNHTLMMVDRSCGSASMCQISASLLLIVSSYAIALITRNYRFQRHRN